MTKRTKTFQTVEIENGEWQVFCLETGENWGRFFFKANAVACVARLNSIARKAA